MFQDTPALKEVVFTACSKLWSIDEYAFDHSGLESFVAPPQLREIGSYAFSYCEKMKEVKFNEGLETIAKYAFSHCGLTRVVTPGTLRKIGDAAFEYCGNLTRVIIGEGLDMLGAPYCQEIFQVGRLMNLSYVVLPDTLEEIRNG